MNLNGSALSETLKKSGAIMVKLKKKNLAFRGFL
jgi:hypothetical protein